MIHSSEFFWWRLELFFFKELEESLIWKLETLEVKAFSIEHSPENHADQLLRVWLPSYEWSQQDRKKHEFYYHSGHR